MTKATREVLEDVARILHDAGWDVERDDTPLPDSHGAASSEIHLGMVTNVADPENKGRIEVQLPSGTRHWARLMVNLAQHGQPVFLPGIHEQVLVAVGNDEGRQVIVLGTMFDETTGRRVASGG